VDRWEGVDDAALKGDFQKRNMALAAVTARCYLRTLERESGEVTDGNDGELRLEDTPADFKEAMRTTTLRGRCETVHRNAVEWFVDGAHTADSLTQVARLFVSTPRRS